MTYTYFIKKAGKAFDVDFAGFTPDVRESIIKAGLGRIMNDLVAGTKAGDESVAAVQKKLDAWARGEVRTSSERTSDPLAKEVLRLVVGSKGFIKWAQDNGLKVQSKDAQAKAKELATAIMGKPDHPILAKAKANLAETDAIDIEI